MGGVPTRARLGGYKVVGNQNKDSHGTVGVRRVRHTVITCIASGATTAADAATETVAVHVVHVLDVDLAYLLSYSVQSHLCKRPARRHACSGNAAANGGCTNAPHSLAPRRILLQDTVQCAVETPLRMRCALPCCTMMRSVLYMCPAAR